MTLETLQKQLGYQFKDEALLQRALTHRSTREKNNERLEFLGDAVLSILMAEMLFQQYPKLREGDLSRIRANLVCEPALADLARQLELGQYLQLGAGELKTGGRERSSILADAVEAILGAIYIDSGLDVCRDCVMRWYGEERFAQLIKSDTQKDAKSTLQEWLQARKHPLPEYEASITGKAHQQTFSVVCRVEGLPHETCGQSSSRRKAEQLAAEAYLKLLGCL